MQGNYIQYMEWEKLERSVKECEVWRLQNVWFGSIKF